MISALVTSGGGFQGLGLVQALLAAGGIRVLVCDTHVDSPTRYVCHGYLVSPPLADGRAFENFLLKTVERERVNVVFPATAHELRTLARMRDLLASRNVTAAVTPQPLLDQLLDKLETLRFLSRSGLPVQAPVDPLGYDYSCAVLGKPREGWGGRGSVTLESRAAAQRANQTLDFGAYVWSRLFTAFEEYSADFAIGSNDAISTIVLRRRLRTSGGFAVISESECNNELRSLFAKLAKTLADSGGFGLYNAQIIVPRTGEGEPFVSDVNPRIGTSATHDLAEGVNLPAQFVALTTGQVAPTPRRRAVKSVRLLEDLIVPRLDQRPRGLVFDLDDTLVHHKGWMFAKMEALYPAVFDTLVEESAYRLAAAQLIDEGERACLIDRLLEILGLPRTLRETAIDAYRATEIDTPLFDDVEPVLSALKAAGIRLAILTDNPPRTQQAKIRRAPFLACFDSVTFSRECGGEKPNATAFKIAAASLSLPSNEVAMVGDSYFRDGVGAVHAGYAHAMIVARPGIFTNRAAHLSCTVPDSITDRIHIVRGLNPVRYACLDALP